MLLFNLVIFADTIKHILDALFPNPGLKPSSGLWVLNREVMLIVMLCYVMLWRVFDDCSYTGQHI